MAKPKKKPTTATRGYTPKVNASTGFVTGVRTIKRANALSAKVAKPVASRPVAFKLPRPAPRSKSFIDQAGDFIQSRIDLATGKKPSLISRAMDNPNVPNLVRNEVRKIRKAQGK